MENLTSVSVENKNSDNISDNFTVETYLPVFPGFYNTIFGGDEENEIDYIDEKREENHLTPITDYNVYKFDYRTYHNDVAKACCNVIENELKSDGFVSGIKYQSIHSPREYNFETDSIYIEVVLNNGNVNTIINFIQEHVVEFEKFIKEQFTSYDGFISWYSNDPEEWLSDIENCIKHKTQLGVLLEFICQVNEIDQNDLYDGICENVNLELENYNDLTEKEYCHVCKEFVDPSKFKGNCCSDCLESQIESSDVIICKCCKEQITNVHEVRHFTYQVNSKIIKYSDIICSECLLLKQ